ncbi:MAG: GcrA family cell cycle regulator [Acetobacteraceae bacterium]
MDWSDETIVRLRAMWSEGHSTAEIGRRLGTSKNAVVGKAHRLDLPPRPSPIRRDGSETPPRPPRKRIVGSTLPPLHSVAPSTPSRPHAPPALAAPPPPPRVLSASPRPSGRIGDCCWPLGEPGTVTFHFCGCETEPGKPYCTEHAKIAYVRIRDRHEDAA